MNPSLPIHKTAAVPPDALDHLLEAHLAHPVDQLTPSSGFALSVMDAIHQQASAPPPIAFPWRRALPGAIAVLCALAAFILFVPGRTSVPIFAPGPHAFQLLSPSAFTYTEVVLASILLAACISAVAVAASFRLAGRR